MKKIILLSTLLFFVNLSYGQNGKKVIGKYTGINCKHDNKDIKLWWKTGSRVGYFKYLSVNANQIRELPRGEGSCIGVMKYIIMDGVKYGVNKYGDCKNIYKISVSSPDYLMITEVGYEQYFGGRKYTGGPMSRRLTKFHPNIKIDLTPAKNEIRQVQKSEKLERERIAREKDERKARQLAQEKVDNVRRLQDAKTWEKGDKICFKPTLLLGGGNVKPIQAFIEDFNASKTRFKVMIVKVYGDVTIDGVKIYRDAVIWLDITKGWWYKCN